MVNNMLSIRILKALELMIEYNIDFLIYRSGIIFRVEDVLRTQFSSKYCNSLLPLVTFIKALS